MFSGGTCMQKQQWKQSTVYTMFNVKTPIEVIIRLQKCWNSEQKPGCPFCIWFSFPSDGSELTLISSLKKNWIRQNRLWWFQSLPYTKQKFIFKSWEPVNNVIFFFFKKCSSCLVYNSVKSMLVVAWTHSSSHVKVF